MSLHLFSLFIYDLLAGFLAIWYAGNSLRFDNTSVHFSKAWTMVKRAIKSLIVCMEVNGLLFS